MPITRCCNNNKIERKFKEKKFDLKNTQRRKLKIKILKIKYPKNLRI